MTEPHYGIAMGPSISTDRSGVEWKSTISLPDRGTELVIFGLKNEIFGLCEKLEEATGECIDPYADNFFSPEKSRIIVAILKNALEELDRFPDHWQELNYIAMPAEEKQYSTVSKDVVTQTLITIISLLESSISRNHFFAIIGN